MYWNIHIKRWPPNGAGLTLTWDVLKFPIKFRMADDEGD